MMWRSCTIRSFGPLGLLSDAIMSLVALEEKTEVCLVQGMSHENDAGMPAAVVGEDGMKASCSVGRDETY